MQASRFPAYTGLPHMGQTSGDKAMRGERRCYRCSHCCRCYSRRRCYSRSPRCYHCCRGSAATSGRLPNTFHNTIWLVFSYLFSTFLSADQQTFCADFCTVVLFERIHPVDFPDSTSDMFLLKGFDRLRFVLPAPDLILDTIPVLSNIITEFFNRHFIYTACTFVGTDSFVCHIHVVFGQYLFQQFRHCLAAAPPGVHRRKPPNLI